MIVGSWGRTHLPGGLVAAPDAAGSMRVERQPLQLELALPMPARWRRVMMRLLTIVCLSAASLQIAIWCGLVAGWTTTVGSSLGDAATALEQEPRYALTSPPDPLNRA